MVNWQKVLLGVVICPLSIPKCSRLRSFLEKMLYAKPGLSGYVQCRRVKPALYQRLHRMI